MALVLTTLAAALLPNAPHTSGKAHVSAASMMAAAQVGHHVETTCRFEPLMLQGACTLRALPACVPQVPEVLQGAEWALPPVVGKAADGEALMNEVLTWLPGMLQTLELGDEPEEGENAADNDSEFVDMARPWLHTKAFGVIKAPAQPEMAQELWAEMSGAEVWLRLRCRRLPAVSRSLNRPAPRSEPDVAGLLVARSSCARRAAVCCCCCRRR